MSRRKGRDQTRDDIERAIADDPTDPGNFSILADYLQSATPTDPRGELIALMLALDGGAPDNREGVRRAIEAVFARNAAALLGPLQPFSQGFEAPPYVWRAGYIQRVEVRSLPRLHDVLGVALDHPSGQFVTEVALAGSQRTELRSAIAHLARAPRLVRSLAIGANQDLGDLDALWPALPRLRHLTIEANGLTTSPFGLAELEYATFTVPFAGAALHAVATARWPRLKHLRIMFTGETAQLEHVEALFHRSDLPALRYLALNNFHPIEGALVERLVRAPWLGQLVALDLMGNRIGDREAFALAAEPARFRPDLSLTVPLHELSPRGLRALRVLDPRL
ncbi:MAG: hypothetical protein NT062_22795 [Proteobacteria bacterium]|nr:hypothetical protein [Pseudomonadota bacterium]